ncbi:hypothetical protein LDENG_00099620 [Lucifuga dentata]|nr:hypothetical protein LDENG_00099620 [Lucifuga dentata]
MLAPHSCVTFPQASQDLSFPLGGAGRFLILSIVCHTLQEVISEIGGTKFIWHGLKKDMRKWAETCVVCQSSEVHHHTKTPQVQFMVPKRRTTRWLEAVPLSSMTWAELAFVRTLVVWFGTPSDASSNRGPQFISELCLGVKLHCTTMYHPQANGLCKWFHHSM